MDFMTKDFRELEKKWENKWNKPGGERQLPYDLTYKWNLINKTNKWVK